MIKIIYTRDFGVFYIPKLRKSKPIEDFHGKIMN